jgi:hypothetical protein
MKSPKDCSDKEVTPDQRKLTGIQAKRLGAFANIKATELENLTMTEATERLKWLIDPRIFFFRRICGKVVKKDPVTGVEYPVPFATVYVEDTDCNLISYFPSRWPWGWFFPIFCRREVIATATTDKCGNFCVWVPRFDIDWVLRWRRERICFPIIFTRPSIGDLLSTVKQPVLGPRPPRPGPDPGPLDLLTALAPSAIDAVAGRAAGNLARQVGRLQASPSFGVPTQSTEELLGARAFETELPPPLPAEFHQALAGQGDLVAATEASATEGIRSAIAMKLGLNPQAKELTDFHPSRSIGPFCRCYDIFFPEWQLILDVPDITFRVTQDTNGDGVQENIYSEGYFDVRWNTGDLPPVTLVASSLAKESHACETPIVPCGTVPAILFAGLMPLDNPVYFNATNGYALRPNRPIAPDGTRPSAQAPFCGTLQLYGCVNVADARFYRVVRSTDGGTTFSSITGLSWNIYTFPGGVPVHIAADASGWYEVLANPTDFHPERLVLEWPSPALDHNIVKIEIGDIGKHVIGSSANVAIKTDNTYPTVLYTRLAWKFASEPETAFRNLLGLPCPTIHRGAPPQDIEVVFEVSVSAHHLRNASIGTSGCGAGEFALQSGTTSHWHTTVGDNSVSLDGRYTLAQSALEGAYSFDGTANSRAMNPAGSDNGHLLDWYYDPIYIQTHRSLGVAIVNTN